MFSRVHYLNPWPRILAGVPTHRFSPTGLQEQHTTIMNRKFLDRLFDAAGEGEGGGGTGTPPPNDPNAGAPPLTLDAILAGLSTKLPDLDRKSVV